MGDREGGEKLKSKIAIIGNGKTALENKNGEFIDGCDRVIRMNDFISICPEFIGSRIDIYVGGIKQIRERNKEFFESIQEVWCPYPEPPSRLFSQYDVEATKEILSGLNINNVKYLDENFLIEIIEKFKSLSLDPNDKLNKKFGGIIKPSTGYLVIEMALRFFQNAEVFLTGFDGFKSGHYWTKQINAGFCHPFEEEFKKIEELKRAEKVTMI